MYYGLRNLLAPLALLTGCATTPPELCRSLPKLETITISAPDGSPIRQLAYPNDAARIAHLRCSAELGIQSAQVEMARRYETGAGVPQDLQRAVALYERAAADVPRTTPIYSPPVRPGGSGRVILVNNPGGQTGSAEARYRLGLMLLEGRGIARNVRRSREQIARAAAAGHLAAREWLAANGDN